MGRWVEKFNFSPSRKARWCDHIIIRVIRSAKAIGGRNFCNMHELTQSPHFVAIRSYRSLQKSEKCRRFTSHSRASSPHFIVQRHFFTLAHFTAHFFLRKPATKSRVLSHNNHRNMSGATDICLYVRVPFPNNFHSDFFFFLNVNLQGRRADLELRHKQGKENPEELHYKQHCAWLWWEHTVTVTPRTHLHKTAP